MLVSLFAAAPATSCTRRRGSPAAASRCATRSASCTATAQLFVTFVVMVIVSTFAFNYGVALPKLADERWGGESWFGLVLSVTSIGSFAGRC